MSNNNSDAGTGMNLDWQNIGLMALVGAGALVVGIFVVAPMLQKKKIAKANASNESTTT